MSSAIESLSALFYDPDLYDADVGPGFRVGPLYLEHARRGGGPVLELGCGTGDVLIPIIRAGIDAVGIDSSPRMLARARERVEREPEEVRRRVRLFEGRMEEFRVPEPVRQVFLTNDVVAHLLDAASLRATLDACAAALHPEGELVMDVTPFDVRALGRRADPEAAVRVFRGRSPMGNGAVQVWECATYEPDTGVLTCDFHYEYLDAAARLERTEARTLHMHPRPVDELVFALQAAGFRVHEVAPLGPGAPPGHLIRARTQV
jgi:SAM-dependent methyltransferase